MHWSGRTSWEHHRTARKVTVLRSVLLYSSVCWQTVRGRAPPDVSGLTKSGPKSQSKPFNTRKVNERERESEYPGNQSRKCYIWGKVNSLLTVSALTFFHWQMISEDSSAKTRVSIALLFTERTKDSNKKWHKMWNTRHTRKKIIKWKQEWVVTEFQHQKRHITQYQTKRLAFILSFKGIN